MKAIPNTQEISIDVIIKQLSLYAPHANFALLSRGYQFALAAHFGQVRKSGEPYLHHPMEVALILTQLRLPLSSIIAGLLHDVLEDTAVTRQQISDQFGEDVAALVDGVTKIGQIKFKSMEEKQAENFRKMIVAVAQDFRILLIKLSDRLHNMRTLQALSEEQQKRIARETMEIYAPLANRLGIGWMKSELENHAFRYINPDIYKMLVEKVASRNKKQETDITTLMDDLKKALTEHNLHGKIAGRTKNIVSIYKKMIRQDIPFEEVYDLIGIRVITDSRIGCYAILGLIHLLWSPVPSRFKDFIALPKSNLYQSIHTTVAALRGQHVEFQIRTEEMHRVAEEGIAAHWVYKEGGNFGHKEEKAFAWLRQLIEWQQEIVDTRQYMDSVKTELFDDMVYVLTPKGDPKELLRGSTPIDFAYSIHTEIGNHCIGAKINGKVVPLGQPLKNGDRVEIMTSDSHLPNQDWLNIVKTPKAKARIKQFIRVDERVRSVEIGKGLLERALKREQLDPLEIYKSEPLRKMIERLGMNTIEDLYISICYGRIRAASVIWSLLPEPNFKRENPEGEENMETSPFKITGFNDPLVYLSQCCNPVHGDPIIGFLTQGRGISIHAIHCPDMDHFDYDPDRLVEVIWEGSAGRAHRVDISVLTVDQPGVLAAVTTVISHADANISRAEVVTTQEKKATLQFCIVIRNLAHLDEVLHNIERVEGVLKVHRLSRR